MFTFKKLYCTREASQRQTGLNIRSGRTVLLMDQTFKSFYLKICRPPNPPGELTMPESPADSSPPACGGAGWPWRRPPCCCSGHTDSASQTHILLQERKTCWTHPPHPQQDVRKKQHLHEAICPDRRLRIAPSVPLQDQRAPGSSVGGGQRCWRTTKHVSKATKESIFRSSRSANKWRLALKSSSHLGLLQLLLASFLTPYTWMLQMLWTCRRPLQLQQTTTDDSKKVARLWSSLVSCPERSTSASSQLIFRFLKNPNSHPNYKQFREKAGDARLSEVRKI